MWCGSMSEESEKEKPVSRREVLKMIATGAIGLVVGAVAGYAAKPAEVVTKTVTSATTSTVTTEVTKTATVTETVTPPAPPVVTVEKPIVKEVPTPELKVAKVIAPKPELCAGCRLCELVCALTWEGKTDPAYSRIRIKEFFGGLIVVPTVCIPCADKVCVKVCPTGALSYDSKTGAIVLDETKCTKCGACFDACPAGALAPHPDTGLPMTCNKCSLCVNI
ncbi:MAG TPA: 4Fe-4S dicluster domain-containing protein, partial [Acidilobales archaeon]|nr:4Fe-4S dicluster domain-containing protein [Acidilobales archaeon]